MSLYLDANALLALLTPEALADGAQDFAVRDRAALVVSDFATAEYASAVSRRVRAGVLSRDQGNAVLGTLRSWLAANARWTVITPADRAVAAGFLCRPDLALLSPGAVHLAAARRLGAALVTLDDRLAAAARALGIAVAEP